ncbi:MAG TPA: ABC transporter substrate-binding protein [Burkholderiales bacterium]|nr:ABC transporter substrate-binding protein [Burkholderiales bacterium]
MNAGHFWPGWRGYNELNAKRVGLLKETLFGALQIAVLLDASNPANPSLMQAMQTTAQQARLTLHDSPVRGKSEFDGVFALMRKKRVDAVVLAESPMTIANTSTLAELTRRNKLPSIGFSEIAEAGGLISYGVRTLELWSRAAYFVHKVLKGSKPGDIPIEQPTKFELMVNQKTAAALGIKIPNSILLRADKVIE